MTYREYKEVQVPDEIQSRLEAMSQTPDAKEPATLSRAGFFDWINGLSKDEGWRVVWQCFNFPFIVLERDVVVDATSNLVAPAEVTAE